MQLLLLLAATFTATAPAAAQQGPAVRNLGGLSVGTLMRTEQTTVPFASGGAAVFVLEGANGRDVEVTLSTIRLTQQDRSSGRSDMAFTLLPELCAYSTDEGATWTPFASTILQTIPLRSSQTTSTVYIRIGGRATASSDQHRGSYSGSIVLTAIYK